MKYIQYILFFFLFLFNTSNLSSQVWEWTGEYSTDWNFPLNWSTGLVPHAFADVQIYNSSTGNYPIIIGDQSCNHIIIFSGSSVTISPGSSLHLFGAIGINGQSSAFYNSGSFTNHGDLIIGKNSPYSPGSVPFWHVGGYVNNKITGTIEINGASIAGMSTHADLINHGSIILGVEASPNMQIGIQINDNAFTNTSSGSIEINRTTANPMQILNSATLYNEGDINVGNNQASGINGIEIGLSATLENELGGLIEIENVTGYGLLSTGEVINMGEIDIKSDEGDFSVANTGDFTNSSGGIMNINKYAVQMNLLNTEDGVFKNYGIMNFGRTGNIAPTAIQNQATFTNYSNGEINIDRSTNYGLVNTTNFTNNGEINIGDIAGVGILGLNNIGTFGNSGTISINRSTLNAIQNTGVFNNLNNGEVKIGSLTTSGTGGVINAGSFVNSSAITINRVTGAAITNNSGATFTNAANSSIKIGNISLTASNGIENSGTFNQSGFNATIEINRTSNIAFLTTTTSSTILSNGSLLKIGNLFNSGIEGIVTQNNFTSTANITIDRVTTNGFRNIAGTTSINGGSLKIGTITGTASYGIVTQSELTMGVNADIEINRFTESGFYIDTNGSVVINGDLIIGNGVTSGLYGIQNYNDITLNSSGTIKIDKTSNNAISNYNSNTSLTNFGTIIIGANALTGDYGIHNSGVINNESSGTIYVDRTSVSAIYNNHIINTTGDIIMGGVANNTGFDIYNEATLSIQGGNIITNE